MLSGTAVAGLAVGLLAASGAWAESLRLDAERESVPQPAEVALDEGAPDTSGSAAELAVEDTAATSASEPGEAATAQAASQSGDAISEQLVLLMGPGSQGADAPLADFYAARDYAPAWIDAEGVTAPGQALLDALADATAEGLYPDEYLNDPVLSRLEVAEPSVRAELDVLMSDAFLRFGNDVMNGRFRQRETSARLLSYESDMDLTQPLRYAVDTGEVAETLRGLAPQHEQYQALRAALAEYRALAQAGGWNQVPDLDETWEQGARNSAVGALRARLTVTGEYEPPAEGVDDDLYYDAELADAVKAFQERHGLLVDAVIGPRTLAALNTSAEHRVRQIEATMERWRWYPRDLGTKHVLINVPAFRVHAFNGDNEPVTMRAVVGTYTNQTPIFNDRIEYSQINPYWNVPQSIADEEYLPALRNDPLHLLNQNIRILSGGSEVNPILVDWTSVGGRFPYRLRQEPGTGNALGRIKFLFPNSHAVYMHDTPQRHLFERTTRSFSHGCIRLQDPMAMAGFLFDGAYTVDEIEAMIATGRTRDLILDQPVPVYVAYFTATVDEDGAVSFYRDLYDRDEVLVAAMLDATPEDPTQLATN